MKVFKAFAIHSGGEDGTLLLDYVGVTRGSVLQRWFDQFSGRCETLKDAENELNTIGHKIIRVSVVVGDDR